jgi:ATP-dependent Lon protease
MIVPLFRRPRKVDQGAGRGDGAEKQILLATQMNAADDDPGSDAISPTCCSS